MEVLITASIGLISVSKRYYLQIITAELYRFYYTPVTATEANRLSQVEGIEIHELDEMPPGLVLGQG